jgi:hypothetical protein
MWVGRFGWYDYQFPNAVNRVALIFYLIVGVAAAAMLIRYLLRSVDARLLTIVYGLLAAGIVVAIARVSFPLRRTGTTIFEQARYLMPLVSLYALALALAATRLRRYAGPAVTVFVAVCVVQLLFAMEMTIARYYL